MCVCVRVVCFCVYVCSRAGAQVKGAVVGLIKEGAQALIIDLRGNVGGYFPAGPNPKPSSLNPRP